MESGDGQQVNQAGLGEAILQISVDATPSADNQGVYQRGAGAIEGLGGLADPSADGPCRGTRTAR